MFKTQTVQWIRWRILSFYDLEEREIQEDTEFIILFLMRLFFVGCMLFLI
nr:MAG TPA: hypothetical protein [Caudoviricetes sp.]